MSLSTPAAAKRLRITVDSPEFQPFLLAAPALTAAPSGTTGSKQAATAARKRLARQLSKVLHFAVDFPRATQLVPPNTYLAPPSELWDAPNYADWTNVGASGLIRGKLQMGDNDNAATLGLRFFDVVGRKQTMDTTCEGQVDALRSCVYAFMDRVVQRLSGEVGIFTTKLAYVRQTKRGKVIYIADVDGRNAHALTAPNDLSLLPTWGPLGQTLLYTSFGNANPDLYRMQLESGQVETLSERQGLNTGAAVAPDGAHIALTLSVGGNTEIYTINADGSDATRLTNSWGQDVSPTWSPDGSQIAFVSSRSGAAHIYVMDRDGRNQRRLTFQGNYNQEPDWSPRPGGNIVFTGRDERLRYDIFTVDPRSGDIARLTQDEGNNESPVHSPDGHHIAYTSTRHGTNGKTKQLYIMDVDGHNKRRVVGGKAHIETPAWSPRLSYDLRVSKLAAPKP